MPIVTIKYDLSNPDDVNEYQISLKANAMACALFEIMYNMKKKMEWEIEQNNLNGYDTLDKLYEKIWEEIQDKDINIDKLIN